ncbi:MAG: gamma-glutamylcyclotransferase [Novosphingobium sp.]|nr:gamma-glutamylcyclotransferase [Novosphingobium sp.]
MTDAPDPLLFSYGTLRQPEVQQALFGRLLVGKADALVGYAMRMLQITDAEVIRTSGSSVHPVAEATGDPADRVEGMAFEVTEAELERADAYEVQYRRVSVPLASGRMAFFYVER